jgi:hypothetical protein
VRPHLRLILLFRAARARGETSATSSCLAGALLG